MFAGLHQAAVETMAARLLYLLSRLALPPLVLSHVGLAEYGLWSIAFVLVSYLGLTASGIATVYVREIARARERDDVACASRILSTGVLLTLLLGGIFCTGLALSLPWVLAKFQLNPALRTLATQLVFTCCLIFLADLTLGAWGYVLHALKQVQEQQRIWVVSFLLEWLAIALLLHAGFGMQALVWAFALRYACSITLSWWRVRRTWPALQLSLRHVSPDCLRLYSKLGLGSQLSDSWATLLHAGDRLLAGFAFGASASALLDLGNKLPSTATSISSGISHAMLPHAATASTDAAQTLYRSGLRLNVLVLLPVMPLLVATAPALFTVWLGPRSELTILAGCLLWMTPAWHLHTLTGAASSTLRGQGRLRTEFIYHALRSVGLLAAYLMATTLPQFIALTAVGLSGSAVLYLALANRCLGAPTALLGETLYPLFGAYFAAYLITALLPWQFESRGDAWYTLLLGCGLYGTSLCLWLYKVVLTLAETAFIRHQLGRVTAMVTRHA